MQTIFYYSQAHWRKVQGSFKNVCGGMVTIYMSDDSKFIAFVRCVVALPFLPERELERENWMMRFLILSNKT